jgi:hypothetical protein
MQSELNELQNRYDDLLMLSNTRPLSADEGATLCHIEQRIRAIVFPTPRQLGELES